MAYYTLHILSETGRIVRRIEFHANNELEASESASKLLGDNPGELRRGTRKVRRWTAPQQWEFPRHA